MQYHGEFPRTHRLCAASDNDQPIRMLGIELLTDPHRPRDDPPELGALLIEYHDGQATVYRIDLAHRQRTGRLHPGRPGLLVIVSGTAQLQHAPGTSNETLISGAVHSLNGEDESSSATQQPHPCTHCSLRSPPQRFGLGCAIRRGSLLGDAPGFGPALAVVGHVAPSTTRPLQRPSPSRPGRRLRHAVVGTGPFFVENVALTVLQVGPQVRTSRWSSSTTR